MTNAHNRIAAAGVAALGAIEELAEIAVPDTSGTDTSARLAAVLALRRIHERAEAVCRAYLLAHRATGGDETQWLRQ